MRFAILALAEVFAVALIQSLDDSSLRAAMTYYVSPNGSDINACGSQGMPCRTIQKGIEVLQNAHMPGMSSTLIVGGGPVPYTDGGVVTLSGELGAPIRLIGDGDVTIDG